MHADDELPGVVGVNNADHLPDEARTDQKLGLHGATCYLRT